MCIICFFIFLTVTGLRWRRSVLSKSFNCIIQVWKFSSLLRRVFRLYRHVNAKLYVHTSICLYVYLHTAEWVTYKICKILFSTWKMQILKKKCILKFRSYVFWPFFLNAEHWCCHVSRLAFHKISQMHCVIPPLSSILKMECSLFSLMISETKRTHI